MTTPIENSIVWRIHRTASDAVRKAGGHFECATECGFLAVEQLTGISGEFKPSPCPVCFGLWQASQKARAA